MPELDSRERGGSDRVSSTDGSGLPDMPQLTAPRKLAEDASSILREQILSGGLKRGTHLVEAKLAGKLGVSRGTVREAFKSLVAEGLIEEEPRRGAFVVTLSRTDVREIYDVRAAIEGLAAELLVAQRDAPSLARLTATIDEIRAAARTGDLRAIRSADLRFHERMCALSGNRRLHQVFLRHVPALQTLLVFDELPYASLDAIADQHQALLDAIGSGDAALAARRVRKHVEDARDHVAAYFEESPRA